MKLRIQSIILAVFMIMLMSGNASAQYKSFVLGIKAAPNFSWLGTSQQTYDSEGLRVGFSWGAVSEFYFTENYAIVSGVNFIWQGGKISYPDRQLRDGVEVDGILIRKYRIKYLEIPAVLKLKTNDMGNLRYFGQIGLGFGIRTNSKASDIFEYGTQQMIDPDFSNVDAQTRLFRTSMIVGLGAEYPFDNNTALVGSINLNSGFTNALKGKNTVTPANQHEAKPSFIEISIGVMF
jgi:hypothetical protein